MQFAAKEDIEAPIDAVFNMVSDFERYERSALRRGIDVMRVGDHVRPEIGQQWDTRFTLRGKQRNMRLTLVQFDGPSTMRFDATSKTVDATMLVDLLSLSQRRTRLSVDLTLKPKTLSARLVVQSLRFARNNLLRRFRLRLADFVRMLEERHQNQA